MSFLTPTYLQRVKVAAMLAGVGAGAGAYWYTKTQVWNSTVDVSSSLPGESPTVRAFLLEQREQEQQQQQEQQEQQLASASSSSPENLFDREDRTRAAKNWNKMIDMAFGKFISLLSDKGL